MGRTELRDAIMFDMTFVTASPTASASEPTSASKSVLPTISSVSFIITSAASNVSPSFHEATAREARSAIVSAYPAMRFSVNAGAISRLWRA